MGIQGSSHSYSFTASGSSVDVDELIAELQKAKAAIGGRANANFSYYAGDQRDPSQLTIEVTQAR